MIEELLYRQILLCIPKEYSDQNTQIPHGAISTYVSMVNNELYIMHVFWKCFWNEYFICEYIFIYEHNAEQKT